MASCDASGSVHIAAAPAAVYALITDLDVLADLAEETARMAWQGEPGARPGARFRGTNRHGVRRWTTTCTVTDARAGERFAFDVDYGPIPIARWAYDLTEQDGGCLVTESATDRRPPLFPLLSGLATGRQDRGAANRANIAATLQRLKARAEAS